MKKLVAVLLSLLMIFSSFGIVGYAADETEGEGGSLLDSLVGSIDYEALADMFNKYADFDIGGLAGEDGMEAVVADENLARQINFLGYTAYDLYSGTPVFWAKIANTTGDESIKGDLNILKANINTYLLSVLKNKIGSYGSVKLYTANNATSFTNFIGKLINPDFREILLTGNAYSNEDGFYSAIADISGLSDVIQHNWIDANVNYTPVLTVFGFDFEDQELLGDYNKTKGDIIAKLLIKAIVKKALQMGPLEYMLNVVSQMAFSYKLLMYPALEALFMSHITRGTIERDELKTMKGLFNLIANGNNKLDTNKVQFINVPEGAFASATDVYGNAKESSTDTTSMFFYMVMYLNLVGKHNNNPAAVDIFRNDMISGLDGKEKEIVGAIIGAMMLGEFGPMLGYFSDMLSQNVSSVQTNIFSGIADFFANIFNSIGKIIERIINSFLHFGEF